MPLHRVDAIYMGVVLFPFPSQNPQKARIHTASVPARVPEYLPQSPPELEGGA